MYVANPSAQLPYNEYNRDELAYYLLSGRIENKFPEGASTLRSIYTRIGRPLRLSRSECNTVVRNAIRAGYLLKV